MVLRTADIMRNVMKALAFHNLSCSSFTISQAAERYIIWLMKLKSLTDTHIFKAKHGLSATYLRPELRV